MGTLSVADRRVDPVKRRGRDDQLEGLLLERPLLKGGSEHPRLRVVGELAPGYRGEVFAKLHTQDAVAPAGQRNRGLSCSHAILLRFAV